MLKYNPLRTREFLEDGTSTIYRGQQVRVFTPLKERPCPSRPPGPDNYWRMFKTSDEQRKEKKQRRDKRRGLALLRMEAAQEKERAEEAFFVSLKQMIMEVE